MTEEKLDTMIREVIIQQIKPQSTRNSYFRKQEDKRRLMRFIPLERLKTIAADFYNHFIRLRLPGQIWYCSNYDYMYIWSRGSLVGARYGGSMDGVRYSSLTGRMKKIADCYSRQNERRKRLIKKIRRRQPRKCRDEIANGSAYKKIRMKYPIID